MITCTKAEVIRVATAFALGLCGLGAQVIAWLILFRVGPAIFAVSVNPRWHTWIVSQSHEVAALSLALAVLSLFSVAAVCSYLYYRLSIGVSVSYERRLIHEATRLLQNATAPALPAFVDPRDDVQVSRHIISDSRACGRALLMMMWSILPLVTLLASIVALALLSWKVAILLIPVAALYMWSGLRLSRWAHEANRRLEQSSRLIRGEVRKSLANLDTSMARAPTSSEPMVTDYLDSYRDVLSLSYRSYLLSDLLLGVTIAAGLLAFSLGTGRDYQWQEFLPFVVAMRYGLQSLRQLAARLTTVSRFWGQSRRYSELVQDCEYSPTPEEFEVTSSEQSPWPHQSIRLRKGGGPIVIFCRQPMTKYTIQDLIHSLYPLSFGKQSVSRLDTLEDLLAGQAAGMSGGWRCIDLESFTGPRIDTTPHWSHGGHDFLLLISRRLVSFPALKGILADSTAVVVMRKPGDILWVGTLNDLSRLRTQIIPHYTAAARAFESDEFEEECELAV